MKRIERKVMHENSDPSFQKMGLVDEMTIQKDSVGAVSPCLGTGVVGMILFTERTSCHICIGHLQGIYCQLAIMLFRSYIVRGGTVLTQRIGIITVRLLV